ncbi:MAG: PAS domain S-box protein [Rhodospirillales bacterium]|nr:PAS domain S-box protein [Rhodospirillales bacterium]
MRAFDALSSHRVLQALALLAPVVLFVALARSSAVEATAGWRARDALQVAHADGEIAALLRLDQVVLDELRARLEAPAAAALRSEYAPAWLTPAVLPRAARRGTGIVALFITDQHGVLRPPPGTPLHGSLHAPLARPAVAKGDAGAVRSLQDAGFFRRLRQGATEAIGLACPVATDHLSTAGGSFVLAMPLEATSPSAAPTASGRAPPGAALLDSVTFRGIIGACIAPGALLRAWRHRLGPGEAIALSGADGRILLRVSGPALDPAADPAPTPPSGPDGGTSTARVGPTPLDIVFTHGPGPTWWSWTPGAARNSLLAFGMLLAAAAVFATGRLRRQQERNLGALTATERFADVLRLSAERYRQLYLGAPAAMHALDPSWRIIAVTDRWLALLGYRREEVLGRRFDTFLAPTARTAAERDWTRQLAGDAPVPARRQMLRHDGTVLDVTLAEQSERDPDGRLRRTFAVVAEPVATPAREVPRSDVLARVAGGVAHDFNNLLMVVMGSLERLLAQPDRPDTVRRLAGMALAAAERGAGLTARLLAAAGRHPLRPEIVNPNRLLREASEAIVQAAGAKVEVQFLLSPVLDPVRLDSAQFRAALLAVVTNAREAMPRGGRLTIQTANIPGATARDGRILVSLSDTGLGMDPSVLARAAEPFFTTRPPGKASGLGLSVAEGFARQSGGSLEIESEPGIGSTIRLILPRSADPPLALPETGLRRAGADDAVGDLSPGNGPAPLDAPRRPDEPLRGSGTGDD